MAKIEIDGLTKIYEQYIEHVKSYDIEYDFLFVEPDGLMKKGMMLIGEAPGRDEVKHNKPFVGMAGEQLEKMLKILNLERDDIYITNVIKYRLYEINKKTNKMRNRPVTKSELETGSKYLKMEIDLLKPRLIVTLGNTALKAVFGEHASIGQLHGKAVEKEGYTLYSLYHPASLIYNKSLEPLCIKDIHNLKRHIPCCR